MSVGTAKLKHQEQRGIKHHFIDELTIYEEYSAGDYALEFHKRLEKYFMRHDVAIIIGCTGLYIHADLHGMENFPDIPEEIRYYLREKYLLFGLETLQEELREKDPDYFHRVDAHTHNAQEDTESSGGDRDIRNPVFCISEKNVPLSQNRFRSILLLLEMPRETMYEKINARVDNMITLGLEEEAFALFPFNPNYALEMNYKKIMLHI
jgi:tRNA dimethylallyltransferase